MKKNIVVFTENRNFYELAQEINKDKEKFDIDLIFVGSRKELVESIVKNSTTVALILEDKEHTDASSFLLSLKRSFPLLKIIQIDPEILDRVNLEKMLSDIADNSLIDRRQNHRFSWPLMAELDFTTQNTEQKNEISKSKQYRVADLSAGGAYLESHRTNLEKGTKGHIRIHFQNSDLVAKFEALDSRLSSSNLPPGFSIRFIDLKEETSKILDKIIDDSLVRSILEPGSEDEIPTIGYESLDIL